MFPESGREGRVVGTRELVVSRFPYLVVYILREDNEVIVQRVLHTSQQWPPLPQPQP